MLLAILNVDALQWLHYTLTAQVVDYVILHLFGCNSLDACCVIFLKCNAELSTICFCVQISLASWDCCTIFFKTLELSCTTIVYQNIEVCIGGKNLF